MTSRGTNQPNNAQVAVCSSGQDGSRSSEYHVQIQHLLHNLQLMGLGQVNTLCFFCSVEDYNSYIAFNLTDSSKRMFSCTTPDSPNSGGCHLFTDLSMKKKKKLCVLYSLIPNIIILSKQKIITALINATGISDICNFT